MNVIFGAGGVALEVAWLMHESTISEHLTGLAPNIFITADAHWSTGQSIDDTPVIKDSDFFASPPQVNFNTYIAIGQPAIKLAIVSRIQREVYCKFPNLIHPSTPLDTRPGTIRLGRGVIIYPTACLTTRISIGDFVHINPSANVAHGAKVGSFSTLCPGSIICGNAIVGDACFIGAGAIIKDGVRIADGCTIGAGAVVISDITEPGTWAGVPARKLDT
ncbi:MAG TPA: NeuD/PglB/VioB family sugar acetyltransferase [Rhodanobacteraceae bacterium]|nr:NeuD/PglB/VioB family sugar acetyltransferase [Rhodanobacteraceae bacterium]